VGLFKKGIHPALAQKLVKISQLRNLDLLDEWYKRALSFERLRRKVIVRGHLEAFQNTLDYSSRGVLS